jgi:O-antigen/teichoic acid export membrane protein
VARRPAVREPSRAAATGWQPLRYGILLLSNQLVILSGGFVVAGIASARAVLAYVLLWRIVSVLVTLVNVVPSTLWSRMALAATNAGDSLLIGRVTIATTLIAACAALGLVWTGEWLVYVWAGADLYAGPEIAMLLGTYLVSQAIGLTALNLAIARKLAWRDVIAMAAYAVLQTLFATILGRQFGLAGVAGATASITLVFYAAFAATIPPRLGFISSQLRIRATALQVVAAFVGLLAMLVVSAASGTPSRRVALGAAVFVAWATAAWHLLPAEERTWIRGAVRGRTG